MPRHIRAADVDAILAHYPPSEFVDGDWEPGYRAVHDGPGEVDGLERYRLELQAAGFCVIPDQQPGGGRRRLHVSKP
jgi:hypothetical protein